MSLQARLPLGTVVCTGMLLHVTTDTAPIGDRRMCKYLFVSLQTRLPLGTVTCIGICISPQRRLPLGTATYTGFFLYFAIDTAPIGDRIMCGYVAFRHTHGFHQHRYFILFHNRHGSHWGPYYVQVCCISTHTRLPSAPVFYFISLQTRLPLGTVVCIGIVYFTTGTAPIGDRRMYRYVVACHHRHLPLGTVTDIANLSLHTRLPMGTARSAGISSAER
jgi:hypothetical protein